MTTQLIDGLMYVGAVLIGSIIGFAFGKIQNIARERYLKRQENGNFRNGTVVIPGSMQRVAMFLIVLVLIQIAVPILFAGNIQWIVSAGVVLGYGWTLLQQLRERTSR